MLDERSDFSALLDLLAAHDLSDLSWVFGNTSNKSVTKLSLLLWE